MRDKVFTEMRRGMGIAGTVAEMSRWGWGKMMSQVDAAGPELQ